MTIDPSKVPPLAHSQVGDVEIVCCLSCCPINWFTRSRTPKEPSSPKGFEPKLAPIAHAIVEEVHRSRASSIASRRPSLANVENSAVGIVEEKKEEVEAKTKAAAEAVMMAGRGSN
jgi:hypothetical protein